MLWKTDKIMPKDKKYVFNKCNSRPISTIPVLSKIMEKLHIHKLMIILLQTV